MEKQTNYILDNCLFEEGMVFSEMMSYFLVIVSVNDDIVKYINSSDNYSNVYTISKEKLKNKLSYNTINGYWVDLIRNDINIKNDIVKNSLTKLSGKDKRKFILSLTL